MKIKRTGSAVWRGGLADGTGTLSTGSGALDGHPYGFGASFQRPSSTNPEELFAAAVAGCFTLALSAMLDEAGVSADRMDTTAEATAEQTEGGWAITGVHLTHRAKVQGIGAAAFANLADKAKAGCPVAKLLNFTLDVALLP